MIVDYRRIFDTDALHLRKIGPPQLTRYIFAIELAAMSILQRAVQVVADSEASLRSMIGEAAASGDYGSVEILARWASALGELCADQRQLIAPKATTSPSTESSPSEGVKSESKAKKTSARRRAYPCFAKSGDSLVKVAWSKSTKSEYQHKSPRIVWTKLADALARHGKNGSIVSMERVLPLKMDDGTDVPDYQVYVCLAWMRQIGAVKQNGRQGYTIMHPSELAKAIESAWCELPDVKPS